MTTSDFTDEPTLLDPPTEVDAPEDEPPFVEDPPAPRRTDAELRALCDEGLPLVRQVAAQVARQLGRLAEREDLESMGRVALVEIARSFDPARASFEAFARRKLRWAMLDGVRRETHGRTFAARARALAASERAIAGALPHAPEPSLPEAAHASRLRAVLAAQATAMALALSAPFVDEQTSPDGQPVPRDDRSPTPEEAVLLRSRASALHRALERLPERQRALVERHYFGGERFDHIAESLGVSKSWASRLHAQALEALSAVLLGEGDR